MDFFRFIPRLVELEEREVPAVLSPYDVMGALISVQFDDNSLQYAYHHPDSVGGNQSLAAAKMIAAISPGLSQTLSEAASQLQQEAASADPALANAFAQQIDFFSSLAITAQQDAVGGQFYVNEINRANVAAAAGSNGATSVGTTGNGLPVGSTTTGTTGLGTTIGS